MKNNRGYSLIELIVTISIMIVFAGMISISVGSITGFRAKECAENIEATLNSVRAESLGKTSEAFRLYKDTDGWYVQVVTNYGVGETGGTTTTKKVGNKNVSISYAMNTDKDAGGNYTYTALGTAFGIASNPLQIEFDRSSGAQRIIYDSSTTLAAGAGTSPVKCVERLKIEIGSKVLYVTIYPETGKVSLS